MLFGSDERLAKWNKQLRQIERMDGNSLRRERSKHVRKTTNEREEKTMKSNYVNSLPMY